MYEVYRDIDSAKVGLIDNILKESGIPTMLRNWSGSNITEIPIPVMYPNICVMNREDIARAREIINEYFNAAPLDEPEWTCPKCGENNDGFLTECWACQTPRPGLADLPEATNEN